jgi:hypothetical protein
VGEKSRGPDSILVSPSRGFSDFHFFTFAHCDDGIWREDFEMVADQLKERVDLYRRELARLDQMLANPQLRMDRRPNLDRVRYNTALLLHDGEARLRKRNDQVPGGTNAD